jgi:hypothetical protein
VLDEIKPVGSNPLRTWAKTNKQIFVVHNVEIQKEEKAIRAAFPDLLDFAAIYEEADSWKLALARCRGLIVVTHETPAKTNVTRPDLATFPTSVWP